MGIVMTVFVSGVIFGAVLWSLIASRRAETVVAQLVAQPAPIASPIVPAPKPIGAPEPAAASAAPARSAVAAPAAVRARGTRFVIRGHELYPTDEFLAANWLQGPTGD